MPLNSLPGAQAEDPPAGEVTATLETSPIFVKSSGFRTYVISFARVLRGLPRGLRGVTSRAGGRVGSGRGLGRWCAGEAARDRPDHVLLHGLGRHPDSVLDRQGAGAAVGLDDHPVQPKQRRAAVLLGAEALPD